MLSIFTKVMIKKFEINGLYYIENIYEYISSIYEEKPEDVIDKLDKLKWEPITNSINSRMVQHYGYKYNYKNNSVDEKIDELPDFLNIYKRFLTDICHQLELIDESYEFNQCIINNYLPAQGISKHVDSKSYGKVIGCFTLGSGASMVFKNGEEKKEIYVKPNSLYIMSDDARYVWTHEMPSRKSDLVDNNKIKRDRRVSLTFRNVKL